MLKKIINILLYAGVDKESYNSVHSKIVQANRMMLVVFSGIGTILIGIMCVISMILNGAAQNRIVYISGFWGALLLFLCSHILAKKYPAIVIYLVYASYVLFLTYGVFIGTITNPDQQTVTFMVMLVFLPIIFIERPFRSMITMMLWIVLFIILCLQYKTGDVLSVDIMDAIIYGVLGSVSGSIITYIKVRNYVLEKKLHDASRFDQLTKMNNRNSFEMDMQLYPSKCCENLSCVYIDVNGLHELNNNKGHKQGDLMLKCVAEIVKEIFGEEVTYRIGGDEFVVFIIDHEEKKLKSKILSLYEHVEKEGCHVAVGCKSMKKEEINMDTLIKMAENDMYRSKAEYYKNHNVDRRSRSN